MLKKLLTYSIFLFFIAYIFPQQQISSTAQSALIEITFSLTDGVGGSRDLTVGLDPNATDGLDTQLGEAALPPPPFGFYARFRLPGTSTDSWKDIRQGDNTASSVGNKTHTINYQLGDGSAGLTVTWDLPAGVELNLQDPFGGVLFNQDFTSGPGNYTVTITSLTSLIMTIKYVQTPFPVELTTFTGSLIDKYVQLNWQTATEVNNYGFDIERSTKNENWKKIGFVAGNGNSNSPKFYSFRELMPIISDNYYYRLKQIDTDGEYKYSDSIEINIDSPADFSLKQNYPNPFNPSTVIKYILPKTSFVTLNIYDVLGRKFKTLVNKIQQLGMHEVRFNGNNLSNGIYFYRLKVGDYIKTMKMLLIK